MKRVLKKDGVICLVENDIGGKFEIIRDRYPNTDRTQEYNNWIESQEFVCADKFETFFKFQNKNEAQKIFANIWGSQTEEKIQSEMIKHNIIIYKYQNKN